MGSECYGCYMHIVVKSVSEARFVYLYKRWEYLDHESVEKTTNKMPEMYDSTCEENLYKYMQ